jgi:OPT family small oligopeptide transporter
MVSFLFWFWLVVPIMYFTNTWNTAYLPISSPQTYTNNGTTFDILGVVTDGLFDVEKYRNYSPVFLSATFIVNYFLGFAALTAVVTHTYLWYGRDIMKQLRSSIKDEKDIHSCLMSRYPDIPHWWFAALFIVTFVLGAVTIEVYDTRMPFWAYIFAIILSLIFILPLGILLAITNQQLGLNIFSELIAGYVIPGKPIAVMIFKVYGTIMTKQALDFSGHLKLGHYMKVPPRILFLAQTIATSVSCFVVVAVQRWALTNIEDICVPGQKNGFSCPTSSVFAEASLLYGGVGPSRLFGAGQL